MATQVRVKMRFKEYGREAQHAVEGAIRDATLDVERHAVQNAPFATGNLRNSIGSQSHGEQGQVYAQAEYAVYQELNPYNQRFLSRALEHIAGQLNSYIQRRMP